MKVVILAGGFGTRLSEETTLKPKPMIEIGDRPMLWHIMKVFSEQGFNEFIIALGYKGYIIKEYFANYYLHQSSVTIDVRENKMVFHETLTEPWKVTLVDTGSNSMTGGRIKRLRPYLNEERFMLTYGDGIADVDIGALIKLHEKHGRKATITAVQPSGRFGAISVGDEDDVSYFQEKPRGDNAWINGGFFVLESAIFDYLEDDTTVWEQGPLEKLTDDQELTVYKHRGFWKAMDTLRDKMELEKLWKSGKAGWKIWHD